MSTATRGTMSVDWEQRVDFDRLREERLAKLRAKLEESDLGALLAFDFGNIRYMTGTHKIGRASCRERVSSPV